MFNFIKATAVDIIKISTKIAIDSLGTALGQSFFEIGKNLYLDFKYLYITPRKEKA